MLRAALKVVGERSTRLLPSAEIMLKPPPLERESRCDVFAALRRRALECSAASECSSFSVWSNPSAPSIARMPSMSPPRVDMRLNAAPSAISSASASASPVSVRSDTSRPAMPEAAKCPERPRSAALRDTRRTLFRRFMLTPPSILSIRPPAALTGRERGGDGS